MYLHLKLGAPAPVRYLQFVMAREFGWTLDYIERLPMKVFKEWLQIRDAEIRARR